MSLLAALLLQADDLGKQPAVHAPGSESSFSRIAIIVFLAILVLAAAFAVRMVIKGATGAAKHNGGKPE